MSGLVWASERKIREEVAEAPEHWFDRFATNQPNDIRKFGDARNASLVFRVPAVLAAIEGRRYFKVSEVVAEAVRRSEVA